MMNSVCIVCIVCIVDIANIFRIGFIVFINPGNAQVKLPADQNTLLSPMEVAKALNVAPVTVRKWAQKQMLQAVVTPGGHRRYPVGEVLRFAKQYGLSYHQQIEHEKLRILIVDDDEHVGGFLRELFADFPEQVECELAMDGFEAGHKIHAFRPDVVLLDIMMPGMDGFDVCRLIKSHDSTRHIRVIAMTGYFTEEKHRAMLAAGAETCLAKPMDIDRLLRMVGVNPEFDQVETLK